MAAISASDEDFDLFRIGFYGYRDSKRENCPMQDLVGVKNLYPVKTVMGVVSILEEFDPIKFDVMTVMGHGAPNCQGLNSGRYHEYLKGRDIAYPHLDEIDTEIKAIWKSFRFSRDGGPPPILFLGGCGVGEETDLIKDLSLRMKNVCVIANQYNNIIQAVPSSDWKSLKEKEICIFSVKDQPGHLGRGLVYALNGEVRKLKNNNPSIHLTRQELLDRITVWGDDPLIPRRGV